MIPSRRRQLRCSNTTILFASVGMQKICTISWCLHTCVFYTTMSAAMLSHCSTIESFGTLSSPNKVLRLQDKSIHRHQTKFGKTNNESIQMRTESMWTKKNHIPPAKFGTTLRRFLISFSTKLHLQVSLLPL